MEHDIFTEVKEMNSTYKKYCKDAGQDESNLDFYYVWLSAWVASREYQQSQIVSKK